MSLASAIRAGVAVANKVVIRGDLTVRACIEPVLETPGEHGEVRYGAAVEYDVLFEESIRVQQKTRNDEEEASSVVTILQTAKVPRGSRVTVPLGDSDAPRRVTRTDYHRDAAGVYLTEVYLA